MGSKIQHIETETAASLLQLINREAKRLIPQIVVATFETRRTASVVITTAIKPNKEGGYDLTVKGTSTIPGHEETHEVKFNEQAQLVFDDSGPAITENEPETELQRVK